MADSRRVGRRQYSTVPRLEREQTRVQGTRDQERDKDGPNLIQTPQTPGYDTMAAKKVVTTSGKPEKYRTFTAGQMVLDPGGQQTLDRDTDRRRVLLWNVHDTDTVYYGHKSPITAQSGCPLPPLATIGMPVEILTGREIVFYNPGANAVTLGIHTESLVDIR